MAMKTKIAENLKRIRGNVTDACARVGRSPAAITLVAVTKTVEIDAIRALLDLQVRDIGESRVQQLTQREARLRESLSRQVEFGPTGTTTTLPRWHMIGHLQRNKVKPILSFVRMIHSVDSLRLAEELNTTAARLGLDHKPQILLQVNTSHEKQKFGLAVGAVTALTEQIITLPNIEIVGLMTMAPLTDDAAEQKFCFERLREIFEELHGEGIVGPRCKHLSMGMSQDYVPAVEAGATILRIGTALFA